MSHFLRLNEHWKVRIVGPIPLGIPKPVVPPLAIFGLIFGDAFRIAIVSFAINISMAKLFSNKYKYTIRSNQVRSRSLAGNREEPFGQAKAVAVTGALCLRNRQHSFVLLPRLSVVCRPFSLHHSGQRWRQNSGLSRSFTCSNLIQRSHKLRSQR